MTLKVAVCAGARIVPTETPLVVNTLLGTVSLLIVTLIFPEFLSETFKVLEAPTVTLPKLKLDGVALRSVVPAVPVPLMEILSGEFEALLWMEAVAVEVPAETGLKEILNVTLWPGEITVELERPVSLNLPPTREVLEILTLALPVFLRERDCEFVRPKGTEEKLTLDGVAERVPNSVSGVKASLDWLGEGKLPTEGTSRFKG